MEAKLLISLVSEKWVNFYPVNNFSCCSWDPTVLWQTSPAGCVPQQQLLWTHPQAHSEQQGETSVLLKCVCLLCKLFISVLLSIGLFVGLSPVCLRIDWHTWPLSCFHLVKMNYHKNVYASRLFFSHVAMRVSRCSCSEIITSHRWFFCLIVFLCCVVCCMSMCTCVSSSFRATDVGQSLRLCVTSQHVYSQRSKWIRYFPKLVLILVCQQETQPSLHLFTALSYLNRKL